MSKIPTGRERRRLRNMVQDPRVQYRYALYFFGFAVAAAVVNQMLMVRAFRSILIQTLVGTNVDPAALQTAVAVPLQALALRMTIMYPIFGMICAAFAIASIGTTTEWCLPENRALNVSHSLPISSSRTAAWSMLRMTLPFWMAWFGTSTPATEASTRT